MNYPIVYILTLHYNILNILHILSNIHIYKIICIKYNFLSMLWALGEPRKRWVYIASKCRLPKCQTTGIQHGIISTRTSGANRRSFMDINTCIREYTRIRCSRTALRSRAIKSGSVHANSWIYSRIFSSTRSQLI